MTASEEVLPYGGVVVQDVDGTINVPGKKEAIHSGVLEANARYISGGGTLLVCTNRPLWWVEERILKPEASLIRSIKGDWKRRLCDGVILAPERGAILLTPSSIREKEGKLAFYWKEKYSMKLPQRKMLENMLNSRVLPHFPGARIRRGTKCILTAENFPSRDDPKKAEKLVEELRKSPEYGKIPWKRVRLFSTHSTLNLAEALVGKEKALRKAIELFPGKFSSGACFGFGDDGDAFASVVPTFNVGARDAFKKKGVPSITYGDVRLLKEGEYSSENTGTPSEVIRSRAGVAVRVLRLPDGRVLRTNPDGGHPIQLLPEKEGARLTAGPATAEIIVNLMDEGLLNRYFICPPSKCITV
jgi:hypothetical protein